MTREETGLGWMAEVTKKLAYAPLGKALTTPSHSTRPSGDDVSHQTCCPQLASLILPFHRRSAPQCSHSSSSSPGRWRLPLPSPPRTAHQARSPHPTTQPAPPSQPRRLAHWSHASSFVPPLSLHLPPSSPFPLVLNLTDNDIRTSTSAALASRSPPQPSPRTHKTSSTSTSGRGTTPSPSPPTPRPACRSPAAWATRRYSPGSWLWRAPAKARICSV